jgi:hypothetical protein
MKQSAMTDNIPQMVMQWPHVTEAIAKQACEDYQREYGESDQNLLESSCWFLWKRTRELAGMRP